MSTYVWVDCEMTGLDTFNDSIIEICVILTDPDLNLIEPEGFERVVHVPEERLEAMTEWPYKMHKKSGLWKKVVESKNTLPQVQQELMEYMRKHVEKGRGILAGSSVHMDKMFLQREFPEFIDYLFYRIIDVSTIKELAKHHNPKIIENMPAKKYAHTARSDILESIAELRWYLDKYLRPDMSDK